LKKLKKDAMALTKSSLITSVGASAVTAATINVVKLVLNHRNSKWSRCIIEDVEEDEKKEEVKVWDMEFILRIRENGN